MQPRTLLPWALAAAGLALLALLVAGPAAAQTGVVNSHLTLEFQKPVDPIAPGTSWTQNVTVTYRWEAGAATPSDVTVTLEAAGSADWHTVTVEPASVTFRPTPVQPGSAQQVVTLTVTVAEGALAFQEGNLTLKATASPAGNLKGQQTEATATFRSAFVPKTVIQGPEDAVVLKGGTERALTFLVRNEGNHEVRVEFDVDAGGAVVTIPPAVTLAPGEETSVLVTVRTPWNSGAEGAITLKAKTLTTGTEHPGDTPQTRVAFVSESAVPAATPLLAGLAVAGLALVFRRARR